MLQTNCVPWPWAWPWVWSAFGPVPEEPVAPFCNVQSNWSVGWPRFVQLHSEFLSKLQAAVKINKQKIKSVFDAFLGITLFNSKKFFTRLPNRIKYLRGLGHLVLLITMSSRPMSPAYELPTTPSKASFTCPLCGNNLGFKGNLSF